MSLVHDIATEKSATPVPPVLQRVCSCGANAGVTGKCPTCQTNEKLGVRPKVRPNTPDDGYEKEADRTADQVVAGAPRMRGETDLPARPDDQEVDRAAAIVAQGGRPLPRAERAWFEARLGRDLSSVRIHHNPQARAAADGIGALAYTLRNHIAFAPGAWMPGTAAGRHLIAHELAHTLQPQLAIARKPKARGKDELMRLVYDPAAAHRAWDTLSKADREYVLARMGERYARPSNKRHNAAWVDEFETLRGNGFDPGAVVHEYRHPAPKPAQDMDEEMLAAGYSLSHSWVALGSETELWIRPSGKTVYLVRDLTKSEEQPGPSETPDKNDSDSDLPEEVPDFAQSEIEELFGFPIPHFVMASLIDEDDEGNRTIKVLQARVDEEGWEEPKVTTITCFADDTCTVDPRMFAFD